MASRHTPRPLVATTRPSGAGKMRTNYERKQKTPSVEFCWDTSLYLQAKHAAELGYQLSPLQRQRLEDGRPNA